MIKSTLILLSTIFCLNLWACSGKKQAQKQSDFQPIASECIDSSKINREGVCPAVWDPVCGCDGKTYGNSCEALHAGVTKTQKGECEEK